MLVLTALVVEHRLARVARVSCIGGGDAGTDCSSGDVRVREVFYQMTW